MKFLLYIFASALPFISYSQGIKGEIVNAKGEPLPYVTISVPGTQTGCNSNVNGQFELKLPSGTYSIHFQSIDYKAQTQSVVIGNAWTHLKVKMEEQTYELKEVKINSSKENPANHIMRKAIAAAPYYRRQVLSYHARVYIKGTGRIDESPKLLKGLINKQGIEIGRSYVTESINELDFKQPKTYKERVVSLSSSMPFEDAPEPMRMATGSIYDTGDGTSEEVSPLSPQAFGVYEFTLEGSFFENGYEVNKVKVKPKRKGNDLQSGYLYILEKLWCVHSSALSQDQSGMTVLIKTSFKPLPDYPYIWMPVTYDISAVADVMGVKGSFRYLASLSNYSIKLNPNINHQWVQKVSAPPEIKESTPVQNDKKEIKKSRNQQEIEALLAKEELNKREMLKLASKMKKEAEKETQTLRLENDSTSITVDSMATRRDSIYWEENRPIPLLKDEQISFVKKDSSNQNSSDSLPKKKSGKFDLASLFLGGGYYPFNKKKHYFSYDGILEKPSLNAVEGVALQTQFSFGKLEGNGWRYTQVLRAPLERPRFQTTGEFIYYFNPKRFGSIGIKGGTFLMDYNPLGIGRYTDAFQLLVYQTNFSKSYQQDFLQLQGSLEIANGLNLSLNLLAADRYGIDNLTRYGKKEGTFGYTPNIPVPGVQPTSQRTYQCALKVSYKPFQPFQMRNNHKQYLYNKWPTFSLLYKEGINQNKRFNKIDLGLEQDIRLRHWLNLFYQAKGGYFFQNNNLHFADYHHFAGSQSWLYEGNARARFQQLPYYDYSSSQYYKSLFLELSFKKLFLRQLPYLNLLDFKEQIYFNYLHTKEQPVFYETGYRCNQIMGFISAGINFHFISNQYKGSGFYLSLSF